MTLSYRPALVYHGAADVKDERQAAEFLDKLVKHNMRITNNPREKAEAIERSNIGYYGGYFDHETRARIERLFNCEHPLFGSIAKNGPPSFEEAFLAGVMRGLRLRDRGDAMGSDRADGSETGGEV